MKIRWTTGRDGVFTNDTQVIAAGGFLRWFEKFWDARLHQKGSHVPCGGCRACCTSAYFIHIRPDETQTLARIPNDLLFAAPELPEGHVLMGYDENGHCPMYTGECCSIYAYRPKTYRDYDCRVFAATGISVGDDKASVEHQSRRWTFQMNSPQDQQYFAAVQTAALFINKYAHYFPPGFIPPNATQQAVMAVGVYNVFLERETHDIDENQTRLIYQTVERIMAADKSFRAAPAGG